MKQTITFFSPNTHKYVDCPLHVNAFTTTVVNLDHGLHYIVFFDLANNASKECWPPTAGAFPHKIALPLGVGFPLIVIPF